MLCLKKNHKKLVPIIMALIMAVLMVSCLSMSVFAGDGEDEIQGNSPYCMKKSEQAQLVTNLGESAKLEGFVSEDPEVATVNSYGVVEAVGPGETTITAQAKLVDSGEIQTVTYNILVKGLVAEFVEIAGNESTIKGTAYGAHGKKVVDGDLNKADIEDIISSETGTFTIKDAVTIQNGGEFEVNQKSGLHVKSGGEININSGSTLTVDHGGKIFVDSGGEINVNSSGEFNVNSKLFVNSGGTLNIDSGSALNLNGSLLVNSGGALCVGLGSRLNVNGCGMLGVNGTLDLKSGGTLNLNNTFGVNLSGKLYVRSGATFNINSNGVLNLNAFGTLNLSGILKFKNAQGIYDTVKTGTYTNKEWRGL